MALTVIASLKVNTLEMTDHENDTFRILRGNTSNPPLDAWVNHRSGEVKMFLAIKIYMS